MVEITIPLPEERIRRLEEFASQAGMSPEGLLAESVEAWLERPDRNFAEAAAYVLEKNRELYRRLA